MLQLSRVLERSRKKKGNVYGSRLIARAPASCLGSWSVRHDIKANGRGIQQVATHCTSQTSRLWKSKEWEGSKME